MARFSFKQAIYRVFTRQYGLTLKADASLYLEDLLQLAGFQLDGRPGDSVAEEVSRALSQIAEALLKQRDACADVVTRNELERIVHSLQRAVEAARHRQANDSDDAPAVDVTQHFHVIDAFGIPGWDYATDQKTFVPMKQQPAVCAPAEAKANLFRSRFHLLRQRLARNEMFCAPAFAGATDNDYLKITSIQSMLGCEGAEFLLFGMLSQIRKGSYFLEDLDSYVELDLSECVFTTGIFTENCFVLAEGLYTDDGIFKARTLGLPPPERREQTTSLFGNSNFFGAATSIIDERILERAEKEDFVDECFVILSDVWLDQPKTLSKLRVIFDGFAKTVVPLAFLLCGNFISEPYLLNGKETAKYREGFDALADIITEIPELSESLFVFIPGANDPSAGEILPRPPIPDFFVSKFKARVPHAVFATNPCRVKFCTQEIVIFRENLLAKLRRNAIHVLSNHDAVRDGAPIDDLKRHLVRTVCDQAHLCPMLLSVRPIYWAYDHALRLYPLPHTLILADSHDRYIVNYEGCHCINPGSFSTSDYKFLVYYPGTKTTQPSEVPAS